MKRFGNGFRTALVLLAVAASPIANADTVTVGGDASCDHGSVQGAIDALPASGPHTIRVANSAGYAAQAIHISGRVLSIEGGYELCSSTTSAGTTTLSGAGGERNSVITVTGSGNDVRLSHLLITGGDETADGDGGGIDFAARGHLYLTDVEISGNSALDGGGLAVRSDPAASATLGPRVHILNNTASGSGGGILVEYGRLVAEADDTLIAFNHAPNGYGGGIDVRYTTGVDIGSPGSGSVPAIYFNDAAWGGGIAVEAGTLEASPGLVRLYTTDPTRPVRISANSASHTGGGVFLHPYFNVDLNSATSTLCASDFRIDDNDAIQGAAIYADSDYSLANDLRSTQALLNASTCEGIPARPACARSCLGRDDCNSIDNNSAAGEDAGPANGATILLQNGGYLDARSVSFRNNVGGHLIRAFGDADDGTGRRAATILRGCEIVANPLSREMLRFEGDRVSATLEHCTLAGNVLGGASLFRFDATSETRLTLKRSVIWEPGMAVLSGTAPGALEVRWSLVHDFSQLSGATDSTDASPRFVGEGDYHLRAASPAVDFAPAAGGVDLDGVSRGRDLPFKPNYLGATDLGAFERPALGPLVLNSDFDTGLAFWPEATGGISIWDTEQNASGPAGSGSVRVEQESAPQPRVAGRSQCVHVPGPGTYALNGWGRSGAGAMATRDYVYLNWEYRRAGGEACTDGFADASGDHFLSNQNSWRRPGSPALIEVPES
ncbi:MAG TPA: hypothetical protein VJ696_13525, partial [Rhodanobacteraceae bacterium]|nr:hypothetical protein [Rhodanobacteraceae bacterium]